MESRLYTPVLFLIFNQPKITMQTFQEIRKARPKKLFISADGPRLHKQGEFEECAETRKAVLEAIDWDCQVNTRFLETNLGCKSAVSSAITWFLDQAEEGIILEYDCVPSQSFFTFCQELLEKYRHEPRVMAVSGSNYQLGQVRGNATYYFSRIPSAWGWATWKRAWSHWDGKAAAFPSFQGRGAIQGQFRSQRTRDFWTFKFDQCHKAIEKTWGYPWCFAVANQDGVCASPNVNMVTNVGFTENATNAVDTSSSFANVPRYELGIITHPDTLVPDAEADEFFTDRLAYLKPRERFIRGIKRIALFLLPVSCHGDLKSLYRKLKRG